MCTDTKIQTDLMHSLLTDYTIFPAAVLPYQIPPVANVRPSGLSSIWPRCVVSLISSSQASLSYLHGNPASVNDHILTCAPTKGAHTLVSVITDTGHYDLWSSLQILAIRALYAPISPIAGTPDTVSLMTCGTLSSCWHLDPSLPPVSTVAPITCGLTPVVRP